jgi:hypothetical protein
MAEGHVVTGLVKKYTELLGLLKRKDAEAVQLREDLRAVAKAISLYKPDFDASAMFPKQSYTHNLHFPRGKFFRTVLGVMREANEPLTARELALRALQRQGAPTDTSTVEQFRRTLNERLVRACRDGIIVVDERERPKRWGMVR